jgi:hypothetical protein
MVWLDWAIARRSLKQLLYDRGNAIKAEAAAAAAQEPAQEPASAPETALDNAFDRAMLQSPLGALEALLAALRETPTEAGVDEVFNASFRLSSAALMSEADRTRVVHACEVRTAELRHAQLEVVRKRGDDALASSNVAEELHTLLASGHDGGPLTWTEEFVIWRDRVAAAHRRDRSITDAERAELSGHLDQALAAAGVTLT